jgi:hypothetical protein
MGDVLYFLHFITLIYTYTYTPNSLLSPKLYALIDFNTSSSYLAFGNNSVPIFVDITQGEYAMSFNPLAEAQAAALGQPARSANEKIPATLWLNVGVTVQNAKGEDEFISLPVGIPLDNHKELSNTSFNAAKLALLQSVLTFASDIPAGGTKNVPTAALTLQIRRVDPTPAAASTVHDFSKIFG